MKPRSLHKYRSLNTRIETLPRLDGRGALLALLAAALVILSGVAALADPFKRVDEETRSVPVKGESSLYVKNVSGKTIIVGRHGLDAVSIHANKVVRARSGDQAKRWMDELTFSVNTDGNQISIISNRPEEAGREGSLWALIRGLQYKAYIEFTIEVPSNFSAEVSAASGDVQVTSIGGDARIMGSSGDVFLKDLGGEAYVEISSGDFEGVKIGKDAKVRLSSGDAIIKGVGGTLDAEATSGDVEAYDIAGNAAVEMASGDLILRGCGGDVAVRTASGDADLRDIAGAVKAVATSGDIHVTIQPVGGKTFDFNTSSGDIHVVFDTPANYGFMLDATTSSGTIAGEMDIRLDKVSRRVLRGVVGTGQGRLIIETASGDIQIEQASQR